MEVVITFQHMQRVKTKHNEGSRDGHNILTHRKSK